MFQKAYSAQVETLASDQPKAHSFWSFRRRATVDPATNPAASEDATFAVDSASESFGSFGRSGLQLGGLHRDQQWVGAWGGRC
jgi:hypothetical protein